MIVVALDLKPPKGYLIMDAVIDDTSIGAQIMAPDGRVKWVSSVKPTAITDQYLRDFWEQVRIGFNA